MKTKTTLHCDINTKPKLGEHVHNLGQSGHPEVVAIYDDGQVRVHVKGVGDFLTFVSRDNLGRLFSTK